LQSFSPQTAAASGLPSARAFLQTFLIREIPTRAGFIPEFETERVLSEIRLRAEMWALAKAHSKTRPPCGNLDSGPVSFSVPQAALPEAADRRFNPAISGGNTTLSSESLLQAAIGKEQSSKP
jgi:hypothetical protein